MQHSFFSAKDIWISAGLFVAALSLRPWLVLQLPFPQLSDPAVNIQTTGIWLRAAT
jgi:hypothetical protein